MAYSSRTITLPAGKIKKETLVDGYNGKIVAGHVVIEDENKIESGFLNLTVKNSSRNVLIDPIDVRSWKQRQGGDYLGSMIPLSITDSKLYVELESTEGFKETVNIQLVFVHQC